MTGGELSSNYHSGASHHYASSVGCGITHSGCGFAAYHYRSRTFDDGIGRSHASCHIAHYCGRQFTNQHRRHSRTDYRASYVRNGRNARSLHRAGVHICYSCCIRHIILFLRFPDFARNDNKDILIIKKSIYHYHCAFDGGLARSR